MAVSDEITARPPTRGNLCVEAALTSPSQNEFVMHHCKPEYIMVNRWLPGLVQAQCFDAAEMRV